MYGVDKLKKLTGQLKQSFNESVDYVRHIEPATWQRTAAYVGIAACVVDMGASACLMTMALAAPTIAVDVAGVMAGGAALLGIEEKERRKRAQHHRIHHSHHHGHKT